MKAITVKGFVGWAVFNANYTILRRYESIEPTKLAIHVGKFCSNLDCEKFSRNTAIKVPPVNRLPLGQVIGVVDVVGCDRVLNNAYDWKVSNPSPVKHFFWKGQTSIYELPDSEINFDTSRNPIVEEFGYKSGTSKGEWRVTVWPHPYKSEHYSYAVAISGGVLGNGVPGHDTLHGCYTDAEAALQSGIEEVYRESH